VRGAALPGYGKLYGYFCEGFAMTTITIDLPDRTAQAAEAAGLLTSQALNQLLSDALRKQASNTLKTILASGLQEELTPEIEQEIVQIVHKVRAEQRKQGQN